MTKPVTILVLTAAVVGLALVPARGVETTLAGVPAYHPTYYGCGPTAAGMIIGYWDGNGYGNLITGGDGSNSWTTNQAAVKAVIASQGHIDDYWGAPDPLAAGHTDNCIADFMLANRDPLADGESDAQKQDNGLVGYAAYAGYTHAQGDWLYYGDQTLWDILLGEIDAGRPMEFFVDVTNDAEAEANHFVAVLGYRYDVGGGGEAVNREFACHDCYDDGIHWHAFRGLAAGETYGIETATWFNPAPEPATFGLLLSGAGVVVARCYRRKA